MVFSSFTFLFIFLPIVLIFYYISKDKFKNYILLFSSLIFYSWGEPKYIILMIVSIIINYFFSMIIDKYSKTKFSKVLLLIIITFNIGMLFAFKYLNFTINNLNYLFNIHLPLHNIALPIGISFYTFQILTYIIDVYKKKVTVQKNILFLGMYISFFPQLIAGPIIRYSTIEEQINLRKHSLKKFCLGLERFILGLSKKVVIANNVAIIADNIFNNAYLYHFKGFGLVIGSLAYTLQIYFDFSGYSDMAIGLGKMFGFDFLENFDYPYVSESITDFWRRWHISLSTLFRDYVYIPLGGNRVNKIKWIRNIVVVWILTGLWHGASWNYIIWGLYFALILLMEKIFFNKILNKFPKFIRWIYSFFLINIGWIIFRIENVKEIIYFLKSLFIFKIDTIVQILRFDYSLLNYIPFIFIGLIFSFPTLKQVNIKIKNFKFYEYFRALFFIVLLLISVVMLISNSYNPFIYFRF